jgi:hypothetical protein
MNYRPHSPVCTFRLHVIPGENLYETLPSLEKINTITEMLVVMELTKLFGILSMPKI